MFSAVHTALFNLLLQVRRNAEQHVQWDHGDFTFDVNPGHMNVPWLLGINTILKVTPELFVWSENVW